MSKLIHLPFTVCHLPFISHFPLLIEDSLSIEHCPLSIAKRSFA